MAENPRTDAARAHDDSDLIEGATSAPSASGTAGGNLARDIASQDELAAIDDPEGSTRPRKDDAINNDQTRPSARRAD